MEAWPSKAKNTSSINQSRMWYCTIHTGEWQPLDYWIFGNLIQRARAALDETDIIIKNSEQRFIKLEVTIGILMECWFMILEEEIINTWSNIEDEIEIYDSGFEEEEIEIEFAIGEKEEIDYKHQKFIK